MWHSAARLGRRRIATLGFIAQMPRVAALLELADDVIGDRVALLLCEPLLETAHYLAGAAKSKGDWCSA